jgi:hypothetical protein
MNISVEEAPEEVVVARHLAGVGHSVAAAHNLMALPSYQALGCPSHTCIERRRRRTAAAATPTQHTQPQNRPPSP